MSRKPTPTVNSVLRIPIPLGSSGPNSANEISYQDLDRSKIQATATPSSSKRPISSQKPAKITTKANNRAPSASRSPSKKDSINLSKIGTPAHKTGAKTTSVERNSQAMQEQALSPKSALKKALSAPEQDILKNIDPSPEEIREKMFKVFQYYTSFVEHGNVVYLKNHRFTKMMVDAEVRNEFLTQSSLDLLYVGELRRSGNLDFERFMKLLARIAKVKYGVAPVNGEQDTTAEESPENNTAMHRLLREHMFPLYTKIFKGTCVPEEEAVSQISVDKTTHTVLGMLGSRLEEIWGMYFSFETQTSNEPSVVRQRMENALFMFLRDFNITPELVSKGSAYSIWQDLMRSETELDDATVIMDPNMTTMTKASVKSKKNSRVPSTVPFTYEKFKTFLVRIASQGIKDDCMSPRSQGFSMMNSPSGMGMGFFQASFSMANTPANGANTQQHQMSRFFVQQKTHGTGGNTTFMKGFGQNQSGFFNQDGTFAGDYKMTQCEKTLMLLERMDTALRVLNPEKKGVVGGGKLSSLLISQEAMTKIANYLANGDDGVSGGKVICHFRPKNIWGMGLRYEQFGITDDEVIDVFNKYQQNLLKIFQHYSSFSQPLNFTRLSAFKFHKLLREAGLLQALNEAGLPVFAHRSYKILHDVPMTPASATARNKNKGISSPETDIIISSLSGPKTVRDIHAKHTHYDPSIRSPFIGYLNAFLYQNTPYIPAAQNRLEFEAFLKSLEVIGHRLYPDMNLSKAVVKVLEKNVLKLEKEIDQIHKDQGSQPLKILVDMLQDPEMVEFLAVAHKSLMVYYKFYAHRNNLMNIERFMQFCKDFDVFPTLMSKARLCNLFRALSEVRAQAQQSDAVISMANGGEETSEKKKKKKSEVEEESLIDEHMFVEALAVCAIEIPYLNPQPTEMEKVFNFLQKLNISKGPMTVRKAVGNTRVIGSHSWDLMHEIKIKYPGMFIEEILPVSDEEFDNLAQEKMNSTKRSGK